TQPELTGGRGTGSQSRVLTTVGLGGAETARKRPIEESRGDRAAASADSVPGTGKEADDELVEERGCEENKRRAVTWACRSRAPRSRPAFRAARRSEKGGRGCIVKELQARIYIARRCVTMLSSAGISTRR
ncbi:hypothetical protein BHE74_00015412, partial [Ensete ventricosum]